MLPAIGSATKAKKKPALDVSDDDESGGSGEGGGEEGSDGEGSEAGGDVKPSQPAERVRSSGVRLINVQDGVESTEQHGGLDAGANGGRFLGDEDGEAGVEFRSLDDDIDAGERPRSRMAVPSRTNAPRTCAATVLGPNPPASCPQRSVRCAPLAVAAARRAWGAPSKRQPAADRLSSTGPQALDIEN